MQEYGTIVSTIDTPTTRRFSFVVGKGTVRKGQFVQVHSEEGILIGRVADIVKTNRYYMRPDSVKEYESHGQSLGELFPVKDWEFLVAEVVPMGIWDGLSFQNVLVPPSPGVRVVEPETPILAKFFGMDPNGVHIGEFIHNPLSVQLNVTRLLQKHMAILAMSGAGKSYLMSVILEELLARPPEESIAIVILDPHGEYACFADDPRFAARVRVFPSNDLRIGVSGLNAQAFAHYAPDLSAAQVREIERVYARLRKDKDVFTLTDMIDHLEADTNVKSAVKDPALTTLSSLARTGLFGVRDSPSLDDIAVQGTITVIDLSDTVSARKKQMIASFLSHKLFTSRQRGTIPPFLFVVEEAHQFVPETDAKSNALARGDIITIAREGRKFHASLCLISQRPKKLSNTALSQCNTNIILRITNPYDLKHIEETSEGITRDVVRQISSLRVGTGLLVGEAVNYPLMVKIRSRKSTPSSKGLPLEDAARAFFEQKKKQKEDAKAFM